MKKSSAILAMVAAAIIIPATLLAWGPSRPTFTMDDPADYVTFNSITDNTNYGDERNFVTIKDASDKTAGGWVDDITVNGGKEYYVRMYVHNNAAANLNLVAHNVTASFNVPDYSAKRIQVDGYLSSTNAEPSKIWDQAVFSSPNNFSLEYVNGSATYTNNVFTSGKSLSDSVIGSGVKLGYRQMDGDIQGCMQYTGLVIFKVKAISTDYKIEKTVRISGATDKTFKESVTVNPGDKVDYQIYFENTGGTQLKDVVIKDTLPAGMTYVPGTTYLANSNGTRLIADGITGGGAVIGGYVAGGNAYIKFTAKVADNNSLPNCGTNTLVNTAKVTTSDGSKEDTANVTVKKTCKTETVVHTCDALNITKLSRTSFQFKVGYTTENATFKSVTYVIRDANGNKIDEKTSTSKTLDYTSSTLGTYSVQATINSTAGSKDYNDTSEGCKSTFTVSDTVTPSELPKTGAGENIMAILGLGAMISSAGYYFASRRTSISR